MLNDFIENTYRIYSSSLLIGAQQWAQDPNDFLFEQDLINAFAEENDISGYMCSVDWILQHPEKTHYVQFVPNGEIETLDANYILSLKDEDDMQEGFRLMRY